MTNDETKKLKELAEEYIKTVSSAKENLKNGNIRECLSILGEVESSMQITLALAERYDPDKGPIRLH